ncbi:hypothetical protein JTB14_023521 [Gonioctena quinquepunctata]|nr:hypothetical protein JTB14_023521 [Gonioctena quinquepunctata]
MLRLVATCILLSTVCGVEFQITNKELGGIWVGIQGDSEKPSLKNGGFLLESGATISINSSDDWAGRFWARSYCFDNHCLTGDCGNGIECKGEAGAPPATLVEITLRGWRGLDHYGVSLVDGFNIAASIEPVIPQTDGYSCERSACLRHLNYECPKELVLNSTIEVVGCKSACLAIDTDQYCCRGKYNSPQSCRSSDWPVDYVQFFKSRCPNTYTHAFDDHNNSFTCKANKYYIQFGISR